MSDEPRSTYCHLDDHGVLVERICTKCHALKPREEFYKQEFGPGKHHTICKSCFKLISNESRKKRRKRKRKLPQDTLLEHNIKMLTRDEALRCASGEFRLMNVKTRSVSPELIIHEAHPGEHIVCLRKRIQGEFQLLLLDMKMDGDTLQEMLLHNHWKIVERKVGVCNNLSEDITHLENIRRLPFSCKVLKAMISSHTYHLWMANPRPLTRDEISDVYDIEKRALDFILDTEKLAIPPGGDILENSDAKP